MRLMSRELIVDFDATALVTEFEFDAACGYQYDFDAYASLLDETMNQEWPGNV